MGLSLLVSACGESSTASRGAVQQNALASALAYSKCMRSHGVPSFPDPDPQGQFPPLHSDSLASKEESVSASDACKSLLRSGGMGSPQDRQEKLAFALKVARCLRAHGYPNFPDPTVSSQGTSESLGGAGIDANSPQFQAAETTCEKQARQALGLP
jgi:hypothetical protein